MVVYGKTLIDPDDPTGPYQPTLSLNTCPISYISDESFQAIELFQLFQTFRVLPESGGLLEQPARLIEMLQVVATEFEQVKSHTLLEQSSKTHRTPRTRE